jgi:hypothetical protein
MYQSGETKQTVSQMHWLRMLDQRWYNCCRFPGLRCVGPPSSKLLARITFYILFLEQVLCYFYEFLSLFRILPGVSKSEAGWTLRNKRRIPVKECVPNLPESRPWTHFGHRRCPHQNSVSSHLSPGRVQVRVASRPHDGRCIVRLSDVVGGALRRGKAVSVDATCFVNCF